MRGVGYNGKERNDNTMERIKFLKEGVEKHGGHFLVVVAPSKESVIPENLPSFYDDAIAPHSDYRDFIGGYQKNNISYIDISPYFRKLETSSPGQLFTKTGFHWSTYGASIAQDTILKYCQSIFKEPMPYYVRKGVEWSDTARGADADFEDVMNLPFKLQQPRYVYPKLEMAESTLNNKRPKVIIIGDSFFWQIKFLRNLVDVFSEDSKYWYYFKKSFPLSDAPGVEMESLNIIQELESADFVVLLGSMGTLGEFPFGVADYYYDNFSAPPKFKDIDKKKFSLKASNNKYVCADIVRNNIVIADRDFAAAWETFALFRLADDKCAIYTDSNKFFSADLAGKSEITASRGSIADWETFTLVEIDSDYVAFKAANGKYLSLDEKTLQLFAVGDSIGPNEKFKMIGQ